MGTRSNGRSSGTTGGSATLHEPSDTATDRIRQLAADGKTGVLQIVGSPGGLVYIADGHIVYAESLGTPGAEVAVLRATRPDEAAWAATVTAMQTRPGRKAAAKHADEVVARRTLPPVGLDAALQSATADALLDMLAGYGVTVTRTRFVNGQRPWIALGRPLTPDVALAETARRLRLLAAVGQRVRPDDDIVRAAATGPVAVRLSPQQWDLVRLCPERRTPRDLAWSVGRGVLATTIEVCELIELGVLKTASSAARGGRARDGRAGGRPGHRTVSFLTGAVPGIAGPEVS